MVHDFALESCRREIGRALLEHGGVGVAAAAVGVVATAAAEWRDGAVECVLRGRDPEDLEVGEDCETQRSTGYHDRLRVYGCCEVQADGTRVGARDATRGSFFTEWGVAARTLGDSVGERVSYFERRPGCVSGRLLVRQARRGLS